MFGRHPATLYSAPQKDYQMSNHQDLAETVAGILFAKAQLRLNAMFAEHGALHPEQLPESVSTEILRRALVETAAVGFPSIDLPALSHDILSFMHSAFHAAAELIKLSGKVTDVFEPARGVDSAVVLAGYGLPVAPYDLEAMCIRAKPTNDIDAALALFSRGKTAFVGYDACSAPFCLFMTNCGRTLRQRVPHDPEFSELKMLFERDGGAALPVDPGRSFRPALGLFPRRPEDTISSVAMDVSPTTLIVLSAGWEVEGRRYGASSDGCLPVPLWLVHAVINQPGIAGAFRRAARAPASIQ
jgi:hypothetical protein